MYGYRVLYTAGYKHALISAKLYCLVTEAHVCKQLAPGCYLKVEWPGVKLSNALTITPPGHKVKLVTIQYTDI